MGEDTSKATDAPSSDDAPRKSPPESESGGFPYKLDFLIALISLLFPFGWSVSGFPPSIILACICWVITLLTFSHFFWNWSCNKGESRITRWGVILGVPVVILIIAWKPVADQYRLQHPNVPLVQVVLQTIPGLPEGIQNNPHLRYHRVLIQNPNQVEIGNFYGRLQLPEPIDTLIETKTPPGISMSIEPILTKFSIIGDGNRKLLGPASSLHPLYPPAHLFPGNRAQLTGYSDGGEITGVWQCSIDKLPPQSAVTISFLTSIEGDATNYISLANYEFKTNGATISTTIQGTTNGSVMLHSLTIAMIVHTNRVIEPNEDWHLGTNELRFYFEGFYQYAAGEKSKQQPFLVPFVFETNSRAMLSLPIQKEDGKWRRVTIEYQ
jgi:hypothetical protein